MSVDSIQKIHRYWFGDLSEELSIEKAQSWFQSTVEKDSEMRELFAAELASCKKGELNHWAETPDGRLSLILLLDQFYRNVYRGTAEAFSGDAQALKLAREAVKAGEDKALKYAERWFLYLPYEHSEDLKTQEESVRLFADLAEEVPPALEVIFFHALDYAKQHYEVIKRFGRYPHRNQSMGRESTPEEIEFLKQPNSSF